MKKHCYETDAVFAKHVFNRVSIMYKKVWILKT